MRQHQIASTPAAVSSRKRLLSAAVKLFADHGFAGSSMRDLARVTGMSVAGLYHHFESKDQLLYEMQRDAFERLLEPVAEFPSDSTPAEKIQRIVRNHLEFFTTHITDMKVLSHELETLEGDMGKEISHLRGRYYEICLETVTELLRARGRADLDPRVSTMTLFGMMNWIYRWYGTIPGATTHVIARQMADIFLNGVTREQ